MVSHCAKPKCRAEFLYLKPGRLFAVPPRKGLRVEFFWLCGSCAQTLTLATVPGSACILPLVPMKTNTCDTDHSRTYQTSPE